MERSLHQAQIADWLGKTPSAWTKVEAGKSPLSLEMFLRACAMLDVSPSAVMATAERYKAAISNPLHPASLSVVFSELPPSEDALMKAAQEYWASPGCRMSQVTRQPFQSILNGPTYNPYGMLLLAPVFLFALDSNFRDQQLQPLSAPPLLTY